MYCLNMLAIALELSREDPAYEDVASKFFEHFVYITQAMNDYGPDSISLWDDEDGFYYDALHLPNGSQHFLKVRSMVGLIPLFAVTILEPEVLAKLEGFNKRMQWFLENVATAEAHVDTSQSSPQGVRRLLSLVSKDRLKRVLRYMLDENEFLSPHGVRSLSKVHQDHPYVLHVNGSEYRVGYEPGESRSGVFGGNSNWRGPVWFPVNFLLIESLQRFHYYFGDDFQVEYPSGSGIKMTLWQVAAQLSRSLSHIFLRDEKGRRPVYGGIEKMQADPHWRDLILFYEYFHAETGVGLGASHQTGWTALVAKLIEQSGRIGGRVPMVFDDEFKNKVALIAGGTGALGREVSLGFLRAGARVIATYRRQEEFDALRADARESGGENLSGEVVDVADSSAVEAMVGKLVAKQGRLDILVDAVGGYAGGKMVWEEDPRPTTA